MQRGKSPRERVRAVQGGSWHRGGVRGRLGNASVEAGGGGLPASACVIASAYWQRLKMARLPGGLGCLMGRLQVRPGKWPRYSLSLVSTFVLFSNLQVCF